MKRFYRALFLLTCTQSILNAHFYENVQETDEIKVFVQPEDVTLTQSGIYLDLENGQSIPLPNIQSNGCGLFTTLNQNDAGKYTTYICPGCKRVYCWWENCNTPKCPYNTRKPG